MRRFASLTAAALVLATASAASAGGYVALGVGSEAGLSGDLASRFSTTGHNDARLALGSRIGRFAVEVGMYGTALTSTTNLGARLDYSTTSIGVDGKYFVPLAMGGRLEAYGRLGVHKTWITSQQDAPIDYQGRSWAAGAGLQFGFMLGPIGEAAVFVDYTHQDLALSDPTHRDLDGSAQMLQLGPPVGL